MATTKQDKHKIEYMNIIDKIITDQNKSINHKIFLWQVLFCLNLEALDFITLIFFCSDKN